MIGQVPVNLKDAISVPDVISLVTAFAGLIIVIGSLLLLYKGVITLQAVSEIAKKETDAQPGNKPEAKSAVLSAISIELGEKIKIQSQYPTLGLFILGIVCFFVAIYYAMQDPKSSVILEGQVVGADKDKYTFTFVGAMGAIRPDISGKVHKTIPKDVEEVDIKVGKGGGEVATLVLYPSSRENGILSFGDYPTPTPSAAVPAPPVVTTQLKANPNQVAPAPVGFPTPLFSQQ
jgi:hypothetical protein